MNSVRHRLLYGSIAAILRGGLAFAVIHAASAAAFEQAQTYYFDIPAQGLGDALRTFARASGQQVAFEDEVVKGKRAPALTGVYTAEAALDVLIRGAGLVVERGESGLFIVRGPANGGKAGARSSARDLSQAERMLAVSPAEDGGESMIRSGPATDASGVTELETIIVTAQKREERLFEVPQSVSVLDSQALLEAGARQFRDFANSVPGLNFTTAGAGQTQITLRGVTSGADVSSTVGVYVDEVPYGSSSAFVQGSAHSLDMGVFDIDRIEVLRGPQGTLYGASSMGGLIKYVTRRPDSRSSTIDVGSGLLVTRHGGIGYSGEAAVNLPIAQDMAAIRLSGFYSHEGGYIDNAGLQTRDVNRSNVHGGKADLLLTPVDRLSIRVAGTLQDIDRDGQGTSDYSLSGEPILGRLTQFRLSAEPFTQRFRLASGTVNYEFDRAELTSVSSYQTSKITESNDLSTFYLPFLGPAFGSVGTVGALNTKKFTQELRLGSRDSSRLEWIFGGFYTSERSENIADFALSDSAGDPAANFLGTVIIPSRYEEIAAFGDLTWHVSRQFDMSGGARYSRNEQNFSQIGTGLALSAPETRSQEDVTTYLANARYRINPRSMAYLRYATGYRPGGPNFIVNDPTTGLPVGAPTFEADTLNSYEAGFRFESLDRRFALDVAAYRIDWKNIQVAIVQGGFGAYDNAAGGATVRGAELSLTARPVAGLKLAGAFAYQDATLDENEPALGGMGGERLPNVPRFTANIDGDYYFRRSTLSPYVGANIKFVSDRQSGFNDNPQIPQYRLPDYTVLDLRAGITLGDFRVAVYVRNVLDSRAQLSAINTNLGTARVAITPPRTLGLNISASF